MRLVIFVLALCGVAVSVLALRVHYSTDVQPCSINEKWDCGVVNHSRFALIHGVPVAAVGIAGYTLLGGLALLRRSRLLLAASLVALAFSLYLTNIEAHLLQVWCLYCVMSQGIVALITLGSITNLIASNRSRTR